jgi:hypothetical protein
LKIIQPNAIPKTAITFRPEYLDFERGIRVGNLDDHARITRILKLELEARYGGPFVTERYGRGTYWRWIAFLARANRDAKPLSSHVSFGCAKFFLMVDIEEKLFNCGLQVERGYLKSPRDSRRFANQADWDWHRLVKSLSAGGEMDRELRRLVMREDFWMRFGTWEKPTTFHRGNWPGLTRLLGLLGAIPPREWAYFQVYYPMSKDEVRTSGGLDLVESMLAIFREVTPAMNLCMQTRLSETSHRY